MTLRSLAEKARPETKGRWLFRKSIFPNDPVNYAYVEWGDKDAGYGTGTLSQTMARYLAAASPDVILRLLDVVDAVRASVEAETAFVQTYSWTDGVGADAAVSAGLDVERLAGIVHRLDCVAAGLTLHEPGGADASCGYIAAGIATEYERLGR